MYCAVDLSRFLASFGFWYYFFNVYKFVLNEHYYYTIPFIKTIHCICIFLNSVKYQQTRDKIPEILTIKSITMYKITNRRASFFCCSSCSLTCIRPAAFSCGSVEDTGTVAVWVSLLTAEDSLTSALSEDRGGFEVGRCPARR